MTNPSLLSKYLAGDATPEEAQQCEELLQDSASVEDLIGELGGAGAGDSLVETLRNLGSHTTAFDLADSKPKSLIEKIQLLVASQPVSQKDIEAVLSPAQSSDEIGRIAHYRVIEFIAGGGMGLVFKAEDSKLNRLVCIKVLHPSLANNRDSVARFAREVQAAAKLRNTRITTVLEFGEHRELPFLVMELLEGQSLRDKINVEGKLPQPIARKLTIQIAEGLRYAHERGYLHRDIKPENIWVTPEGDIKLLDFGLARAIEESTNLTHSGMILGTPTYMSPEQIQGKELDARSDLFSVGTVLFEMLTGESPFGKSNLFSTMMSVANDTLAFPEATAPNAIPEDLKPVIQSLLQKSPEDRVESADQLITALETGDGKMPSLQPKANKSALSPGFIGVLGAAAGACCLAFAFLLFQLNDKGTLVVEADPSINVSIANEEVSIEDPQTGKSFTVTIGENPLPSGVYQLQMTDESGQYTLSSEVIAIRRGEKQIVRVELKPDSISKEDGNAASNKSIASETKPALTLANLPTLGTAELKRKLKIQPGDELFRNALVSEPMKRDGVTSWSIEPTFSETTNTEINSDGSRIATRGKYTGNRVTIWDREGQLTHIIPAQDKVVATSWSPDPNIIAIVESGERRKQITVWKLFENHLEAIDMIAADVSRVTWSPDGLTLSAQGKQRPPEISFIDLSKGSVFARPNFGIKGFTSDHPWSQGGRYFATSFEGEVKVWDLEERKLLHIFTGKRKAQFLPEGNSIAVKDDDKWEIWDLDTFVRTRTIESETGWLNSWPNPQFEKLAILTKEGGLVIQDLESGETAVCELQLDPFYTKDESHRLLYLKEMSLEWAKNGNDFACVVGGTATFLSNADRKLGAELVDLAKLDALKPLTSKYVRLGSGNGFQTFDLSSDGQRMVYHNYIDERKPGAISSFDLETMKYLPATEISVLDNALHYPISPDGKMVAIVGTDLPSVNGDYSPESLSKYKEIRVCSVESGKLIKTFETDYVQELFWPPDSTSLIVMTIDVKKQEDEYKRFLPTADSVVKKLDADDDGKLNKTEGGPYWDDKNVDLDADGFLSTDEVAKMYAAKNIRPGGPNDKSVSEVATRIINLVTGDDIQLQAVDSTDEPSEESTLCFQRGWTSRSSRSDFATPVIFDDQIVLPIFDASTFRNGQRTIRSGRDLFPHQDKLGFFDLKTGKLTDVIELNCQFSGGRLAVSEQLISIGVSSRTRNSSVDSFIVFDRQDGNRAYLPTKESVQLKVPFDSVLKEAQSRGRMQKGTPHLSPQHPLVAVLAEARRSSPRDKSIEIWKLDSKTSTFLRVRVIGVFSKSGHNLTWHPNQPTLSWIDSRVAYSYNAETGQQMSFDAVPHVEGISPTDDGWIVAGPSKMVFLDHDFKLRKSYLPSSRFTEGEPTGVFDLSVTAEGKANSSENAANLRLIQMRENRIETLVPPN